MAYNASGDNVTKPRPPRRWTTPAIIVFAVGLVILVGGLFINGMMQPVQTDGSFSLSGAMTANFRATFLKSFVPALHDGCMKSANAALAPKGIDTTANDVEAKVEAYCGCMADRTSHTLSVFQLISLQSDPSSGPVAAKLRDIVRECQEKTGKIGSSK